MERAKKMVLISTENLERLQQQQQQQHFPISLISSGKEVTQGDMEKTVDTVNTPGTTLSRLDADMYQILNSTTIESEREKWRMYREVLQRYLYFFREKEKSSVRSQEGTEVVVNDEKSRHEEEKEGTTSEREKNLLLEDIPNSSVATHDNAREELALNHVSSIQRHQHHRLSEQKSVRGILNKVPKSYRAKARKLLLHLCDVAVPTRITWDKQGIVTINGRLLNGANIVDLVNEVIRKRKTTRAVGRFQFAQLLREVGTPVEYVGNPELRSAKSHVPKRTIRETSFADNQEYGGEQALFLVSDENRQGTLMSGDTTKPSSKRRLFAWSPLQSRAESKRSSSTTSSIDEEEFFTRLRRGRSQGNSSTPIPPSNSQVTKRMLGDTSLAEDGNERAVFTVANENKHRTRVSDYVTKFESKKRRLVDWEQMV